MVSNVYMVNINLCLPAVWEHQLWSEGRLSLWHNRRRMHPLPPQPGCMINQRISWDQHCLKNVRTCEIVYWVGINYNSRKHENYVIIYSPWCSSKPVWPVFLLWNTKEDSFSILQYTSFCVPQKKYAHTELTTSACINNKNVISGWIILLNLTKIIHAIDIFYHLLLSVWLEHIVKLSGSVCKHEIYLIAVSV